jgi:hypothetical protein
LSKILVAFNLHLELSVSSPSFSTTMLWVKKLGYTRLTSIKPIADDWVIILDESIGIGQEKVLVILGIRQQDVDLTRPLKMQDMEPLLVKSREKWQAPDIANELNIIKQKIGTISYAVSDAGFAIKKALEISKIIWIYDITHAIAITLTKIYSDDCDFKKFAHLAAQMRFKLCNSKQAHLIPPNQRSKSRFLNIDIICKWAVQALKAYESQEICLADKQSLQWVKDMEDFVHTLEKIMAVTQEISVILKNNGLSKKSILRCKASLKGYNSGKLRQFKDMILKQLAENGRSLIKRNEVKLCCSDVIETIFGKYKCELSKNKMSGITDLVLIIPALTTTLDANYITHAIDNCTVKDIENWKKENLCESLLSKRKLVFFNS